MNLRALACLATALLLAALLLPGPARAAERILSFDSDIEILPDGSMNVTERIRVVAEGDQIKRGLKRSYPLTYTDQLGRSHPVGFSLLEVERDGLPEPHHEEYPGSEVVIYIGSGDVFVSHGEHSYLLKYNTTRQISYLQDFDELYYNVTGNEWDFPIKSASATLHLPQAVPVEQMQIEGYTGAYGARGRDYSAAVSGPGQAQISTTLPLNVNEGLTVVFQWPKGVVEPPSQAELDAEAAAARQAEMDAEAMRLAQQERARSDRKMLNFMSIAILSIGAGLFLITWLLFGIDARRADPAALGGPPEEISPAALRYIRKMKYDPLCFTTALVSLGSKGFVRIQQDKEGSFSLKMLKGADDTLPEEERRVMNALFQGVKSRTVSSGARTAFSKADSELRISLGTRFNRGYFRGNEGLRVTGACLSCGGAALLIMLGLGTSVFLRTPWPVLALLGLWGMGRLYGKLIPKYTGKGRAVLEQFEELRRAISGQGSSELLMPSSVPLTPALFSRYLPYALALDLQSQWAQQLEAALKQAGTPPPQPDAQGRQPSGYDDGLDWYYNPWWRPGYGYGYGYSYGYSHMVDQLSRPFNTSLQRAAAPVVVSSGGSGGSSSWSGSSYSGGSSSFGGGGFSGGGGGGGGGGGW